MSTSRSSSKKTDAGGGEKLPSNDKRRILRLVAKYQATPDTTQASKLIAAIYPIVYSACFTLGGRFADVARAARESVEEIFDDLDAMVAADDPAAWIYRRALRVASLRALDRTSGSGEDGGADGRRGLDISTTGPDLTPQARRGVSFLVRLTKARDPALATAIREALDSLPPRRRVALLLGGASLLPRDDIERIFAESGVPLRSGSELQEETAGAALAIFEHLGRVAEDD